MSQLAPTVNTQQQSLKRYKSVRQAQKQVEPPPAIPVLAQQQQQNVGVKRSMSRYKGRPRPDQPDSQPAVPSMPTSHTQPQQRLVNNDGGNGFGAHNFSRPRRDTNIPPREPNVQSSSTRVRANTDGRRQTSTPTRHPGQLQSPSRMTSKDLAASQHGTFVSAPAGAVNTVMPPQVPTAPAHTSPEQKWTNAAALTDLQHEHNRRIKERQRKEKEAKIQAQEQAKRLADEEQRLHEEEIRRQQAESARKADEQRLVEEKVREAKKQAAERRKSTKQSPRRIFSRPSNEHPDLPTRVSNDATSPGSRGRQEIRAPDAPAMDLPVKQVDASVVARPYQPPPKIRKESISQPISSVSSPISRPSADAPAKTTFFDAPKSAINAGERSVIVACNASNTILTVNNDTTVDSILRSAAVEMSHEKINPETAILLESFTPQGVERRLRRYEHVRDILNSWDSDRQNKLMVVPSVTNGTDEHDLFASYVPRREPTETVSLRMHHSSRPGHWDKRIVTLRPGGQISVAKDGNGKDERVVCTLSDFDIYIPTLPQTKRIKAPKKICFAIKSQGRPSMFITGENFVHWFSTKDRSIADQWYVAVQAWRSWYLVEKLGMGQEKKPEPEVHAGLLGNVGGIGEMAAAKNAQVNDASPGGGLSLGDDIFKSLSQNQKSKDDSNLLSKESLGYDLGGLINRIGDNDFTASATISNSLGRSGTQKKPPRDSRGGPPSSYPTTLMARLESNEEPTFAPSGLLGRSYSQRQKSMQEGGRSSLDRGNGELDWGKPLVDLSSKSQASGLPHHSRKFSFATGDGPLIGKAGNYNE